MKKLFQLLAGVFLLALPLAAQSVGPISVTGSNCATIGTFNQAATVGINVSGTWSTTLLTQGTIQGQSAFTVLVTPSSSAIPQSNITANGAYTVSVAGLSTFQICGSSLTGTAVIYLNASQGFSSIAAAGGSVAGSGLIISAAGTTPPSPLATAACPTGEAPFMYGLNGSGNYQDLASWDTSGTPPTPAGQITFCWPFVYNDSGTSIHPNRAFTVFHVPGNGGLTNSTATDESAIFGAMYNTGTGQSFHAFLPFYGEAVLSGTPTFGGHAGGEVSVSVYRGNHTTTASTITGGGGFYVFSGAYEHDGAAREPSPGVYHAYMDSVGGSGNQGGDVVRGLDCAGGFAGTETNYSSACILATLPAPRYPTNNFGVFIADFGTNAGDFGLAVSGTNASGTASGFNELVGPTLFGNTGHVAAGIQVDIQGGALRYPTVKTSTNCAASGTAANPSVVSCAAAPAGAVFCDVAASAGTCTINTTAVTSTSRIFITLNGADGTELSKTCNTATITAVPTELYASKVASTSFTINMPTLTTNGACFEYTIIN